MRGVLGLARSLEGRTVVVLLLAVLLVHGGALAIYRLSAAAAADEAFATEVARQLVIAREAVRGARRRSGLTRPRPSRRTISRSAGTPQRRLAPRGRPIPRSGTCATASSPSNRSSGRGSP